MTTALSPAYLLFLNECFFGTPKLILKLIEFYPTFESFKENLNAIFEAGGLSQVQHQRAVTHLRQFNADQTQAKLDIHKVSYLTVNDALYPAYFKEVYDAPPLIYYQGNINLIQSPCLSVVGPRRHSTYAKEVTQHFVSGLSDRFLITSGLAAGIDSIAHQTALNQGHPTLAIIGSGLDITYPAANAKLYAEIRQSGLILSEFPLGAPAKAQHFPQRNRLVSGISEGVLIVEGAQKSGTMITAHMALDQNREVFAVPQSIFSDTSTGVHSLIKAGATLVTSPKDILDSLSSTQLPFVSQKQTAPTVTEAQQETDPILRVLQTGAKRIDDLVAETQLPVHEILQFITLYEIEGKVVKEDDKYAYNTP